MGESSPTDQSHRTPTRVTLSEVDDRAARMRTLVDGWIEALADRITAARASDQFRRWLDAQARFHDYSYRNTLLIQRQQPGATRVAGYRTWQDEFDRQVQGGESAIWIWAPITAPACPDCGDSASYTDHDDCATAVPPAEWTTDVVGYRPVPVFDVSQTEGAPLPELDTAVTGGDEALLERALAAHQPLGVDVDLVAPDAWRHGQAAGLCEYRDEHQRPLVTARQRDDPGAVTGTLLHEYAHALLHDSGRSPPEQGRREVEAEAVAYAVGRQVGLDVDGAAFYLAAWTADAEPGSTPPTGSDTTDDSDVTAMLRERLARISRTIARLLDALGSTTPAADG